MLVFIRLLCCDDLCLAMTLRHYLRVVIAVLVIGGNLFVVAEEYIDPMPAMVTGNGYPLETHYTTTADGYILGMHRIPFGVKSPAAPNKPAVLFLHGIFCSSYVFVQLGKDHSLAFILADAGYDVWLGNSRGNFYSRNNEFVSAESADFWQFSWHERGTLDLPAMIDYVLEETKQEKLNFVSHSKGAAGFFVLMTTLPEYNDKIKVAVNIVPSVFMVKSHSILEEMMVPHSRFFEWIGYFVGINEVQVTPALAEVMEINRCRETMKIPNICEQFALFTGSYDTSRANKTKLPDIAKNSYVGVSVKEMAHCGQLVYSKRFAMFDYGFIGNIGRYGSLLPPSYDLNKVTAPVVIFSGVGDLATTTQEIDLLMKALPNQVSQILVEDPGFTHFDFVGSDDAKTIVYDKILVELEKYSNS